MRIADSVDLAQSLTALSKHRPVFHSEADFQLALAREVQAADESLNVYLETRPAPGVHLDMEFERLGHSTAIELKYLTRAWDSQVGNQRYDLKNHSAHDLRRYDVVKDITRAESFVQSRANANGAVVVLSNDPVYWRASDNVTASDAAFRIGEGAVLGGTRAWGKIPAGTARQTAHELSYNYSMHWTRYSDQGGVDGVWQLVIEVPGSTP